MSCRSCTGGGGCAANMPAQHCARCSGRSTRAPSSYAKAPSQTRTANGCQPTETEGGPCMPSPGAGALGSALRQPVAAFCNPASQKLRSSNTFGKPRRSLASTRRRRWRASATARALKDYSPTQRSGGSMEAAVEKSAMRKIYLRLLPFAILSYILAYIDRINVSFAGLTMRTDLNLSATDFGFALGTFFLGYFIFEVPSNVIMEKVGARIWIARIMITWGIFAGMMAFVYDTTSFSIVRFLLGVAEAGFFPGMLLYFTYWFPRRHHARIVSGFLVGLPIAVALGAPISTGLLGLDGLLGLKGWQIMYLAEAVPTIVIGVLTLLVLTDRPEQANFLSFAEKGWITAKIASERPPLEAKKFGFPRVFILTLMYVIITAASLGLLYYTPQLTAWLK